MFRLLGVFVCLIAVVYGDTVLQRLPKPRLDGRIVGGVAVNISEIPFQISLQRWGSHVCGGSLIAENWVLTAAHCTQGSSSLKVRIGSTQYSNGGVLVGVKKVHQNKLYNPSIIDYDFSLLELEPWNKKGIVHGFAKLPKQDEDVSDGTPLRVSGWGNTQSSQESRLNLRATTVPKVNQKVCNDAYDRYGGVTDRMLCAGLTEGGKDSCQGDSGGPLTKNGNVLVGVVSWGYGCAVPSYPGVYARVAAVRNWIKEVSNV